MDRRALSEANFVLNRSHRNALAAKHFVGFWLFVFCMIGVKVVVSWIVK